MFWELCDFKWSLKIYGVTYQPLPLCASRPEAWPIAKPSRLPINILSWVWTTQPTSIMTQVLNKHNTHPRLSNPNQKIDRYRTTISNHGIRPCYLPWPVLRISEILLHLSMDLVLPVVRAQYYLPHLSILSSRILSSPLRSIPKILLKSAQEQNNCTIILSRLS